MDAASERAFRAMRRRPRWTVAIARKPLDSISAGALMAGETQATEGLGLKADILAKLLGNSPVTVLLALTIIAGWSIIDYGLKTALPAAISQIQAGYVEVANTQKQSTERLATSIERQRDSVAIACEKLSNAADKLENACRKIDAISPASAQK